MTSCIRWCDAIVVVITALKFICQYSFSYDVNCQTKERKGKEKRKKERKEQGY
eukprot:m.17336 g.17336  ORF g.17336 m.17336 type:complete len:53 (+) comp4769_c0_seq1:1674-1832(+)